MQLPKQTFEVLLLIGRPASGKSEIIDYLQRTPAEIRRRRYHIGRLDVLDDFPMLWTWLEEDELLSRKLGRTRLFTDEDGYFKDDALWHLLIERLSLEYQKQLRDNPSYHDGTTTLVEFARGREHGGYARAMAHLDDTLLQRAGILYVNVSFAESLRKNRLRFNPARPDSILQHSLPDQKLERLYREDDWPELASGASGHLKIRFLEVPYTVFENEDDVTTDKPDQLARRLESALGVLWELRSPP
ncbi:MAG: hypothetical protein ABSB41_15565 [Anaerolineales bacterium]|jgi:adenylate kinase family enzyme